MRWSRCPNKVGTRRTFPQGMSWKEASNLGADLQGLTHVTHKRVVREWLLKNSQRLAMKAVIANRIIRVTGHVENSRARVARDDLVGEFPSRHAGHDHVRQENIQRARGFRRNLHCV